MAGAVKALGPWPVRKAHCTHTRTPRFANATLDTHVSSANVLTADENR